MHRLISRYAVARAVDASLNGGGALFVRVPDHSALRADDGGLRTVAGGVIFVRITAHTLGDWDILPELEILLAEVISLEIQAAFPYNFSFVSCLEFDLHDCHGLIFPQANNGDFFVFVFYFFDDLLVSTAVDQCRLRMTHDSPLCNDLRATDRFQVDFGELLNGVIGEYFVYIFLAFYKDDEAFGNERESL